MLNRNEQGDTVGYSKLFSDMPPQEFYAFMNSVRKGEGVEELDPSLDGLGRAEMLDAHLKQLLAHTDKIDREKMLLLDLDEMSYVVKKTGRPDLLEQAAKTVMTTLIETDRHHHVLYLVYRIQADEIPLNPAQMLTPEQADIVAHRDISGPAPHKYQESIKIYKHLCTPAMLAAQKAAYKKAHAEKIRQLEETEIRQLEETVSREIAEDRLRDAMTTLGRMKYSYAAPQRKINVFGRRILRALMKEDTALAFGFLGEEKTKRLFSNPSAIMTERQVDRIAANMIAGYKHDDYHAFCALFQDKAEAIRARHQAAYDASREKLLADTLSSTENLFWQKKPGKAWETAAETIKTYTLPEKPFAALSARILTGYMEQMRYNAALILLQNDPFLDHGANGLLTPHDIRKMRADFKISDDVAATAGLDDYNRRYKKTRAARINTRLLDSFAPILHDNSGDATAMVDALEMTRHDNVVKAQNLALAPVWNALAALDPHTPQYVDTLKEEKPVTSIFDVIGDERKKPDTPFSAKTLSTMFNDVSRYMNVVQLQNPVIGATEKRPDALLDDTLKDRSRLPVYNTAVFGNDRFGKATLAYRPDGTPLHTQYTFLLVRKNNEAGHQGTAAISTQRLYSMPLVRIDDDILSLTMDRGGRALLNAYQDIETIKNHDYFHHLTARIVNPYFSTPLYTCLNFSEQPYARFMGEFNELDIPDHGKVSSFGKTEHGMESYARKYQSGKNSAELAGLGSEPYEFHAMHIQRSAYQNVLHAGPEGRKMETAIDRFFDGLERLSDRIVERPDRRANADTLKIYYCALIYNALLYVAPYDHPLMQRCEARIDALDINRHALYRLYGIRQGKRTAKTLDKIANAAGLDNTPLSDMTAAQILRWNAYAVAHKYMVAIHANDEKTQAAQKITLPALRNHLSAIGKDFDKARRGERKQQREAAAPQAKAAVNNLAL